MMDSLYHEVHEDLNRIVGPLFDFGEQQVRKRGAYAPFGATLHESGNISLEAAVTGQMFGSSTEILQGLHEGLRARVQQDAIIAVAVCEWVKITRENGQTDAIKVLVEHKRGLTVAFYVPCRKKILKGWQFKPMFAIEAEPEVNPWNSERTS